MDVERDARALIHGPVRADSPGSRTTTALAQSQLHEPVMHTEPMHTPVSHGVPSGSVTMAHPVVGSHVDDWHASGASGHVIAPP